MDIKEILELQQTFIKSKEKEINIIGYKSFEKTIEITSNDEEKVNCIATTNSNIVTFNKEKFKTNFKLKVSIDLSQLKAKDEFSTEIKIISTYNDLIIPIKGKVTKPYINLSGVELFSLKDFYNYFKENEYNGLSIFETEDFKMWIECLDKKNILIYNMLEDDENIKRRVENFLILTNVKKRVELNFKEKETKIYVPMDKENIEGFIEVNKEGAGYFDYELIYNKNCEFLTFEQDKVTSDNFMDSDKYKLRYCINKEKFKESIEVVSFKNTDIKHKIKFYKKPMVKCRLSKELYKKGEIGFLEIENNFSDEIVVVINSEDVELKENSYKVKKKQKIMFEVSSKTYNKPNRIGEIIITTVGNENEEERKLKFKIDLT